MYGHKWGERNPYAEREAYQLKGVVNQ